MRRNTLRVPNPFQMEYPPLWWLNEMHLFDPQLVIFPSQQAMTFVLARRATKSAGETLHKAVDKSTGKPIPQSSDTLIMHRNRLVRVCEIIPGVLWDQRVFQKLAAHDIQRLGGWKAVANRLDDMDRKKQKTILSDQDSELDARSHDGYKLYKYKTGERISLSSAAKHGRGDIKVKPVSVHVRKPNNNVMAVSDMGWLPGPVVSHNSLPPAPRLVTLA